MAKKLSGSSRRGARPGAKGSATSKNALGKREAETGASATATGDPATELAALAALPDDAVDTSDIPELAEDFWKDAKRGVFYRPVKQMLTIRVDADVIDWFRRHAGQDGRYQTRMNLALRDYMRRHAGGAD